MRTIEGKNIPSSRGSGFNQVLIQVQFNSFITICDYDEEYDDHEEKKDTRPNFKHVTCPEGTSRVTSHFLHSDNIR